MCFQNVLVGETESDGEDGAASSHDTIDKSELLLEIVTEDGERWSVDQWWSRAEHDAVCQVEDWDVLVEHRGQSHPQGGQHGSYDGGQPQANLITKDSNQEWQEECCPNSQRPNQSWQSNDKMIKLVGV